MIVKLYLTAEDAGARAVADDLTDVVDIPIALRTLTEKDGRHLGLGDFLRAHRERHHVEREPCDARGHGAWSATRPTTPRPSGGTAAHCRCCGRRTPRRRAESPRSRRAACRPSSSRASSAQSLGDRRDAGFTAVCVDYDSFRQCGCRVMPLPARRTNSRRFIACTPFLLPAACYSEASSKIVTSGRTLKRTCSRCPTPRLMYQHVGCRAVRIRRPCNAGSEPATTAAAETEACTVRHGCDRKNPALIVCPDGQIQRVGVVAEDERSLGLVDVRQDGLRVELPGPPVVEAGDLQTVDVVDLVAEHGDAKRLHRLDGVLRDIRMCPVGPVVMIPEHGERGDAPAGKVSIHVREPIEDAGVVAEEIAGHYHDVWLKLADAPKRLDDVIVVHARSDVDVADLDECDRPHAAGRQRIGSGRRTISSQRGSMRQV